MSIYDGWGNGLSVLRWACYRIFTVILWIGFYDYVDFIDEEIEFLGGWVTCIELDF